MKTKIILITVILILTATTTLTLASEDPGDNYDDYLTSIDILKCDDTVATGENGSITVKVAARTGVDLHIDVKGEYPWGHWTFSSEVVALEQGVSVLREEFHVPPGSLEDPASSYYVYVYATLPGDPWSFEAWGETSEVEVILPDPDRAAKFSVHGPGFGYYWVGDVVWSGVVWAHYDEAGSPSDPRGVWEVGVEGLPEQWYTMCIVDRAKYRNHVLTAEGTFLEGPIGGLEFTLKAYTKSDRWTLSGEGFYFTGFIEVDES
jgi:hypothetical protein